ncbi:MAG: TonB-dependent receptor [Bacteroidota bacterium]
MRRGILLLLIIGCYCPALLAQKLAQAIKGKITDVSSGESLIGASVTILGSDPLIGAISDVNGLYEIKNVPIGRQDIQISYVGYEPLIYRGMLVTTAKPLVLDVAMKISLQNLDEIVVTTSGDKRPLNEIAKVSARSFSLEESQRFAGGLSDPSRVAYSFPGVTFGNPQDNGVVIRGNSPVNVLWRIEGVEVPGASHFGGGNLAGAGLITIFSANVLGTSDFLTGAFPAEYGNATAGVFDINFRSGSTDETKYTAQLGVLGADLAIEGPFKPGSESSYLVNYRHGFIGYYGRLAGGVEPDYQDISFKLNLPSKRLGTLSLWGIGGLSSIFTPFGEYEVEDGEIDQRETESDFQQDDINFDMAAVGVNHRLQIGKKSFLNSSLAVSTNGYKSISNWFEPDSDTVNTGSLSPYTDIESRETKFTATTNLNHQFSNRFNSTTGVILDYLVFDYKALQAEEPQAELVEFLNTSGNTYNVQVYTQSEFQFSPRLSMQAGLNLHHFEINKETTLEPRAGLSWKALSKLTFGLGYGLHSRREEPKVYFFDYESPSGEIRNNESLKRKKANHFILSADYQITDGLRFLVEGYYQRLSDIPVVPDSSYSFANYTQLWELDAQLTNDGIGTNMGIDLSLERSFNKGYYYLLTASFYDSKYTGGDGIERNTLFNRGYLSTITAGKEFLITRRKKNQLNLLGINFNVTYMGGQRITPFLPVESQIEQEAVLDYDRLYSLQSDPELWINAGITYKINKAKSTATWGLDFQNATLNEQLQGYEFNFVNNAVEEDRVLFLLPNFYYKIEF